MISHYAWPGGLALVVEVQDRRHVVALGPQGWRAGDPSTAWPGGPPPGVEVERLDVPPWLLGQLASLEMTSGGLHTDFVHLDRMLARLEQQGASGVVLVLGRSPAAFILTDGRPPMVVSPRSGAVATEAAISGAAGWIVVLAGQVVPPVPETAPPAVPAERPRPPMPPPSLERIEPHPVPVEATAATVTFVAVPGAADALADETAVQIQAAAGEAGVGVVAALDGSRTTSQIAHELGLRSEQVAEVIRILVGRKLAFRYVSRTRPPTGARSAG